MTGAAKGLGAAITDVLACDGAHLVLAGRDREALESHAVRLDDEYPERESLVAICDVTKEDDARAMIGAAVERFGGLDVLVNTAGVIGPIETPAQDVSAEDFRRVLDVNVVGTFLPCKFAIPHLIERGGGRIVNIAGTSGLRGYRNRVSYSSSIAGTRRTSVSTSTARPRLRPSSRSCLRLSRALRSLSTCPSHRLACTPSGLQ